MKRLVLGVLVLFSATVVAQNEEFVTATNKVCEKMKSCSLAELEAQNLAPEIMAMMRPMMSEMCSQVLGQFEVALTSHAYYKPSIACLNSIENLSCSEILNSRSDVTPECAAFRKLVDNSASKTQ